MEDKTYKITEIKEEKFSFVRFLAGFAKWYKILFILILFAGFTILKDKVAPAIKKQLQIQQVDTYIEAPENKPVKFYGLKIQRLGLGFTWE